MYQNKSANQSGYMPTDVYSPGGSPGHRWRQGSYTGSGLESGRASTIGTDAGFIPGLPYNSSRTALNNEWRSEEGHDRYDEKYAAGGGLGPKDISDEKAGLRSTYVPIPPMSPATDEKKPAPEALPPPTQPPVVSVSRQNRMEWIDGIRGLASVVIFTHHFSDLTWSSSHPDTLPEGSIEAFLRNGQLAVAMYFLLGGRVLAHSFLRSAFARPTVPKDSHGVALPGAVAAKWAGPRWLTLSSSLFRRSIRLALPAIVVGFIQWRIAKDNLLGDKPIQAALMMEPTELWSPTWQYIGNFWGFLRFVIDLFTNRQHQYMLYVGSALWTTYDQFWGSVLVYILAALNAQLAWLGRYTVYFLVCVALWFTNSPNMLYVIGLWLADLNAAGYIRRVQDHWKPTVLLECCLMALALAFMAGGGHVSTPVNEVFGKITVFDGKFGWDQTLTWPQYMFPANWIPPACILAWIELSHAMQWFASWGIFVWLGKVSYGFYLMQFITIYSIMPPLVIHLFNNGNSYWDTIIPAYIICLLFNIFVAWVAYHLLDRVGLKLAKWIWDGFFVSKPNNAAALPGKMIRAFGNAIINAPGEGVRWVGSTVMSKSRGFAKGTHTLFHWRTPTTRPPVPDPSDPDIIAQLHSTRWTSDLSHDKEAVRTAKLLRMQQHAWIIHLLIIPGVTFVWVWFHPTGAWTYDAFTVRCLLTLLTVLLLTAISRHSSRSSGASSGSCRCPTASSPSPVSSRRTLRRRSRLWTPSRSCASTSATSSSSSSPRVPTRAPSGEGTASCCCSKSTTRPSRSSS